MRVWQRVCHVHVTHVSDAYATVTGEILRECAGYKVNTPCMNVGCVISGVVSFSCDVAWLSMPAWLMTDVSFVRVECPSDDMSTRQGSSQHYISSWCVATDQCSTAAHHRRRLSRTSVLQVSSTAQSWDGVSATSCHHLRRRRRIVRCVAARLCARACPGGWPLRLCRTLQRQSPTSCNECWTRESVC